MTLDRARQVHSEPGPAPSSGSGDGGERSRVHTALRALPERERDLLLLRSEGFSYRDLSRALGIAEASVGVLLARAKTRFREALQEVADGR